MIVGDRGRGHSAGDADAGDRPVLRRGSVERASAASRGSRSIFVSTPLAPACTDGTFNGPAGTPLSGRSVHGRQRGRASTYSVVAGPVGGSLALSPNGSFTYTPPAGFVGTKTFTFRASDGAPLSRIATATLSSRRSNRAPTADGRTATTDEDVPLPLTLVGTDPDGDALDLPVVDGLAHGTLTGTGAAPHVHAGRELPRPRLVHVPYRATGCSTRPWRPCRITVRPVNDAPEAVYDLYRRRRSRTRLVVPADRSPRQRHRRRRRLADGGAPVVDQRHGTFALEPDGRAPTPRRRSGWDSTRSVTASRTATVESEPIDVILADLRARTRRRTAENGTAATDEDTPVALTLHADDVEDDDLTFTIVDAPAHGYLSGTGPALMYTPDANYHGPDSVHLPRQRRRRARLESRDGLADGAAGERPVPQALDTAIRRRPGRCSPVPAPGVLGNDSYLDGDALTAVLETGPTKRNVALHSDGAFTQRRLLSAGGTRLVHLSGIGLERRRARRSTCSDNHAGEPGTDADDRSAATDEDTALPLTLGRGLRGRDALAFTIVDAPAHGDLQPGPAPAPLHARRTNHGPDSFTFRRATRPTTRTSRRSR